MRILNGLRTAFSASSLKMGVFHPWTCRTSKIRSLWFESKHESLEISSDIRGMTQKNRWDCLIGGEAGFQPLTFLSFVLRYNTIL